MLILTIIGTRPEAVKLAPVIEQLKKSGSSLQTHICVTGQHREMLDQMLSLFDILPDTDLDLMRPGQELSETASAVFQKLDPLLVKLQPDWVVVQGDTTTVMAAAVAAHHRRIKVAH
ncbi:MAG: UDP-N-acetylglucosamine 2-epimerase, partial [Candidatus Promineifilaceae bacterium]